MWTVIFHFGRVKQDIITDLTREKAQEMIRLVVFNNQDCVNFSCYMAEK